MKITAIILLGAGLHVSAKSFSQNLTISLKNAPLEKAFAEIERQTGYSFLYFRNQLDNARTVDVEAVNLPLQKTLELIFKDQPLTYSIESNFIIIKQRDVPVEPVSQSFDSPPPPILVSGRITDNKGNPLAGVSVMIKGTHMGAVSDAKGNYTLRLKEDKATLVFSYVGLMEREVQVNGRSVIDIVMQSSNSALDQVVVVGYGVVKRGDLTGAISTVSGGEVNEVPVASVDQALQGKAAGVQVTSLNGAPGAGTTIRIRGGNSITASNEPLYVVDGFIGGGTLTSINPMDIESIEILKDASATAIYGARGANGVVIITTKHGRKTDKPGISVNAYSGQQELPREVSVLTGPELAKYVDERDALFGTAPVYPYLSKVTNTDWQKAITQKAGMQNANISFSGGSDKVTYYLSGNYFNQNGIILNSGFTRYQTRLNLRMKVTDWLSVGTDLNYSHSNTNNLKASLYDILKTAPTSVPVKDSTGKYTIVSPLSGQTFDNPIADALEELNNTYDNGLLGGWYVEAAFKNGLGFKSTLDIDNDNTKTAIYLPGTLPLAASENIGGSASIATAQTFNFENENTVSYNRNFGKHHVDVLGGFTYQNEVDQSVTANAKGFTNDVLTYNNLSTGSPALATNASTYSSWTIISLLGRANYSYNDKYLFTVSARQDGSSRLAANHKYAFFPSAAFAWKMSNEDFIKSLGWFSSLKFRASYGKTGNQAIAVYSTLASLNVSNAWFNNQQQLGYTLGTIPNSDLKWETTDQYDAGLDAGFLKGRLTLTADAYYKKTYNLLLNVPIAGTTGYTSRLANVGETRNAGVELMVDGRIVDQRDLSWDLSFNIAGNRNKILALGPGQPFIDIADGYRLIVGKPAPVFWGSVFDGVFHTQQEISGLPGYQAGLVPGDIKFKDVNGNGKYDGAADEAIIGNPAPKFFGGFNSLLRYKRFSLNMYFEYSYGNDVINLLGVRWFAGDYASNVGTVALNRWEPTNTQSNIPRAGADAEINDNSQAYSFAVQNGSFLRLKTLQLSYNLAPKKAKWLQGASIYFIGSNLFLKTAYTWGYDPEVSTNAQSPVLAGGDESSYPEPRAFIFGMNLKF